MKASLRRIFSDDALSAEDLSYLRRLLEAGLSLNECFALLKNRRNEQIFADIKAKLDQGLGIETAICDHLPSGIRVYMMSLLPSLSFEESLSLSLDFHEKNSRGRNEFISSLAYPLILLFIAMTSLYLFDLYGIDSIFRLIESFDPDLKLYRDFRVLFRIVVNVFYYGILLLFLAVMVFSSKKRIVLLYLFVSKHLPNSVLNIYYSEEFMSLLLICCRSGYSTKEALEILKKMKNKPVVSFLAFHMDESLMEGLTLREAAGKPYYDSSLSRFIKIANYSRDFSGIIGSYIYLTRQKIEKRMKGYSLGIQLFTYVFIGIIIVFIYQILFMPMQAISSF